MFYEKEHDQEKGEGKIKIVVVNIKDVETIHTQYNKLFIRITGLYICDNRYRKMSIYVSANDKPIFENHNVYETTIILQFSRPRQNFEEFRLDRNYFTLVYNGVAVIRPMKFLDGFSIGIEGGDY